VPTKQDFETELRRQLAHAQNLGKSHLNVNAGELHRDVGEYPGRDHRMPVCCDVMVEEMNASDRILTQPPRGRGASLTIRYALPR
jgi:5-methylcytosine-specific restriction protein A